MRPVTITESLDTPVMGEYEVVVLGGGPSGIAAAASAARSGRSTLLVERYGFLGGSGTAACISDFCGLHANVHGEHQQVVHGIADDIQERLLRLGGLKEPHLSLRSMIKAQVYDLSAYKIVLDQLMQSSGVKLLFHAMGVGVHMSAGNRIDALFIESKSGRAAIRGKVFIDCSGDADIAAWSGAPFEYGDGKGNTLYPSMKFRINNVDPERARDGRNLLPKLMEEAEAQGRVFPRKGALMRPQINHIEWVANATLVKNPDGTAVDGTNVEQMSYGEVEGRRQCWDVFEFIKSVTPGFENAYIVDIAAQLGIRQTRRIQGEYMLTEGDILGCADFEDSIGVNGWPVEAHTASGVTIKFANVPHSRGFNQMPYRMMVPQKVDNLLVAGRCASMTHDGQSSARVSGPCIVMGQAAGTAADIALQSGVDVRAINMALLQERLERDGAYLGKQTETIAC
jgi:FAD dependent oxidoreductase